MPFSVSCPECRYQFRVPDHVAGQRGKCPKCKAMFIAQRSEEESAASADAKRAASATETVEAKPRTLSIPKPRLLEKLTPPPMPASTTNGAEAEKVESVKAAAEPPPAPPRGAPAKPPAPKSESPSFELPAARAAAESGGASIYAHRRAKKSKLPLIAALAALALVFVAAVGAGIGWSMLDREKPVAQAESQGDARRDGDPRTSKPPLPAAGDDDAENSLWAVDDLKNWETIRQAMVTIDVIDAAGTHSGAGGLLPGGLVATDSQLVHEARGAVVTLADGQRFEVAGALRRPRVSLALLRLDGAPNDLQALALAEHPPASAVYLADAQSAVPTKMLRRIGVAALPAALRPRLPPPMRENDGLQLIEHADAVARLPDGRAYRSPSGALLLDAEGRVAGVHLALGGDSRKGYAVGAEELAALVEASGREEFQPLARGDVAAADPLPPLGEVDPLRPLDPPAGEADRFAAALEKFAKLREMLAAKKWRPETAADYLGFAEFAHQATELTALVDKLPAAEQEAPRAKIVAAIESLADARWPSAEEIAGINKLTAADLPSGDSPGVFAYGRCILRPEDFGDAAIDGLPLFAFELPGAEALIVMPIGENGAEIAAGSQWLILGTKDLMQKVQITTLASPDVPRDAAIVRAKYILGQPMR